ncbi:hypothetical protein M1446_04905 [Candidatus Dependentiae bacterium]|nr:hypothetical protein [Candidatus Dependentiae bacterium]
MKFLFFIFTSFCSTILASETLINEVTLNLNFSEILKLKENKIDISKINVDEILKKINEKLKDLDKTYTDYFVIAGLFGCFYSTLFLVPSIIWSLIEKDDNPLIACLIIEAISICALSKGYTRFSLNANLKTAYAIKKLANS